MEVYNCASGNTNPVTWRQLLDMSVAVGQNYPIESMMWYPSISLKKSLLWHRVDQLLYHTVPAYFIDALARVTRAKPTAVNPSPSFFPCCPANTHTHTHKTKTTTRKLTARQSDEDQREKERERSISHGRVGCAASNKKCSFTGENRMSIGHEWMGRP